MTKMRTDTSPHKRAGQSRDQRPPFVVGTGEVSLWERIDALGLIAAPSRLRDFGCLLRRFFAIASNLPSQLLCWRTFPVAKRETTRHKSLSKSSNFFHRIVHMVPHNSSLGHLPGHDGPIRAFCVAYRIAYPRAHDLRSVGAALDFDCDGCVEIWTVSSPAGRGSLVSG